MELLPSFPGQQELVLEPLLLFWQEQVLFLLSWELGQLLIFWALQLELSWLQQLEQFLF